MNIYPPIGILFPLQEKPEIVMCAPEIITCAPPKHILLRIETTEQVEAMLFQIKQMCAGFEEMSKAAMMINDVIVDIRYHYGLNNKILEKWKGAQDNYVAVRDRFPKEFDWAQKADMKPEDKE